MWPFRKEPECRHEWKVLDKIEFASPWTLLTEKERHDLATITGWLFESRVVLTVTCGKCGALRQTEHGSP
jgi:hypothetical protein